ncbi:colicin-like pore-forming protein, partial [Escherichia coli]
QVLRAYIFCGACGNNRTNRGGFQFAAARLPWFKPLFLTLEKKTVDAGVSYIVVLLFSVLAGTTLGIWGIAIVTGILCAFIDKNKLNTINDVLGI